MRQLERQGFRSSMRSRDSSSTTESDPREKIKDCFRKFIAFMCTQVGVGGLVVCYAIVGAFGFISLETQVKNPHFAHIASLRRNCVAELWQVTATENVFNETVWSREAEVILKKFQDGFAATVQKGYDGRTTDEIWSFPGALMFCLSVFTMIGYGNMVPKTPWGKGVTVMYAGLGIPIYILYFMNMGKVLAQTFKWLYTILHECSHEREDFGYEEGVLPPPRKKIIVPSTACLWVISFYVLCGTIMFAEWEDWNYLDSTYFCVTSLCKIGIGDFVPGANISDSRSGSQTKLVINFVYMLLGMGLIAMCYNLMREDVRVKAREVKEDMRQCMEDMRFKISRCIGFKRYPGKCLLGGCFCAMLSPMPPIRLCSVSGYDGRINDVVFCPPALRSDEHSTVVYFGGDVQDFPELMKTHRDNKNYIKWNLENMAAILNINFPRSHIVVIKPSRMEFKTFSCYNNFVPSNTAGVPDHTPTHHALQHLERLLQGVTQKIKTMPNSELREMLSSSLANQQFYMDLDILQENTTVDTTTSILQRELENTRNLTVTTSNVNSYNDSHPQPPQETVPHHVTITSTKQPALDSEEQSEAFSNQSGVIQSASKNQSVLMSSQCQSTIVVNPQSVNSDSVENCIEDTKAKKDTSFNPLWWRENLALDKANLTLIGFSKGCVVLNQLIYEFHYLKTLTPDDSTMMIFVSRISEMFWLDGGHSGGKNSWITSRSLLETLTRLEIKIWIHVTPYQVQDDRRSWIRREEKTFTELLQRLGARVTRTLHFDGATPNLYMHFDVLNVFRSPDHLLGQGSEK